MDQDQKDISMIKEKLNEISIMLHRNDQKIENLLDAKRSLKKEIEAINDKIKSTDMSLEKAIIQLGSYEKNWEKVVDIVWKVLLMVIAGYLLWVMGLQADLAFPPS